MKEKNVIGKAGRPTDWTLERAQALAADILDYVQTHPDCYTMGEAIVSLGYYEDIVNYIARRHNCQFEDILIAKDTIKHRCIKAGMKNLTNATMTIFNLVNNFDMVNTNVKSDITSKGEQVRSIPAISWVESTPIEESETDEPKLLSSEEIKKIDSPKND